MTRHPLEPDPAAMRELGEAVLAFVVDHVEGLARAPASSYDGVDALVARAKKPPPETPGALERLLALVRDGAAVGLAPSSPGYLAYVPSGGLYASALADFAAAAINRYVTIAGASPALAALEAGVVRWLCDLFALPAASAGVLTSGGSLANFSALVTARGARLGEDFLDGVVYTGEHTHHSVTKAAVLAGFRAGHVRAVASTPDHRLDPEALARAAAADRDRGLRPAIAVASAGTTDTGAIDPLAALADVAAAQRLWLHVDAAYGGFFQLTARGRRRLAGIERADSITLDPHKGLFVPLGSGALVVRDGAALRRAHGLGGRYLEDLPPARDVASAAELSPELSRGFRGLRVWLPLHLHGVAAFRAALDEKLDLAEQAYASLSALDGVEVIAPPDLSVVAFRCVGRDTVETDALTRQVCELVNARRRTALSTTVVGGRLALRICVLGHRTHREHVERALDDVRAALGALAAAGR